MLKIGLTGGIASGKSIVSKMLRDLGQVVVDADVLAREVVAENSIGAQAIGEIFGPEVVKDGNVNRAELGKVIFSDDRLRSVLERVTHPLIQWRADREFEVYQKQGHKVVFYDAALIFEKQLNKKFNKIIVINVSPEQQLTRLVERDRISRTDAQNRMKTQWPLEQKVALADFVIQNSGALEETQEQVKTVLKEIIDLAVKQYEVVKPTTPSLDRQLTP